MNSSIFTTDRTNYYRCLINSLELFLDKNRDPVQYRNIFDKMYSKNVVDRVWSAINGSNPFYNLQADDVNI